MKLLLRTIAAIIIIFILLIALDNFITTQTGLNWIFILVQKIIPGELQIKKLQGSLVGPIIINDLHYHDKNYDIGLKQLQFSWQPIALLSGKLVINTLHSDDLTYLILKSDQNKDFSWPNFDLLKRLNINDLQLHNMHLIFTTNSLQSKIQINANGHLDHQWNLQWQVQGNINGMLDANGSLKGPATAPIIDTLINLRKLHYQNYRIDQLNLQLHIDCQQRTLQARLAPGTLNLFNQKIQKIKWQSGVLQASFIKNRLNVQAKLQNASTDVPTLNIHIKNISVLAQGNRNNGISWSGSAQSGQGQIHFTGKTLFDSSQPTTNFYLQGQNVTVVNTSEYQVTASPDLTIKLAGEDLNIIGKVAIPKASFKIGGPESSALQLSDDVVFINEKQSSASTSNIILKTHIELSLGNEVQFTYKGLKTKLVGNLLLTDNPGQPTIANGRIDLIDGKYTYYGQTLDIKPGSHFLYADSPIENPNLNIQAVRTVMAVPSTSAQNNIVSKTQTNLNSFTALLNQPTKVTVGINVQDNAQAPRLNLFADPAILNQTDILSYLVTGQASNQLSAASLQLLFTAANSLNPGQGKLDALMNSLQKTTHLSQFGIQSTSIVNPNTNTLVQNTSLVLGKMFTPKLSVNYSVGLLQPINVLQINYILNKYFTLQSTASTFSSGIDLLYTIQRK